MRICQSAVLPRAFNKLSISLSQVNMLSLSMVLCHPVLTVVVIVVLSLYPSPAVAQLSQTALSPMLGINTFHTHQSRLIGPASTQLSWRFNSTRFISSSPALDADSTLYYGSDKLYAVTASGALKWSSDVGDLGVISSSPAIGVDGTIYVGADDCSLYAVTSSGTVKWSFLTGAQVRSSPAIGSDGTVYVASDKLYAITSAGTLKWSYPIGSARTISSPAVGSDGTIYVGGELLYAVTSSGALRWAYKGNSSFLSTSPAIGSDGTIYVGCDDDKLYAITSSGSLQWSLLFSYVGQTHISSPGIGNDGTIYVGSYSYFMAITPSGTTKWSYFSSSLGYFYEPAISSDGTIYVGWTTAQKFKNNGGLFHFSSTGGLQWVYSTSMPVQASPAIGINATVYFGCGDGYMYALGPPIVTSAPTRRPTFAPSTHAPTVQPTTRTPTASPTTSAPTVSFSPTKAPSSMPSSRPTISCSPTLLPTGSPSMQPSSSPSSFPTTQPTSSPNQPSGQPSSVPSSAPTPWTTPASTQYTLTATDWIWLSVLITATVIVVFMVGVRQGIVMASLVFFAIGDLFTDILFIIQLKIRIQEDKNNLRLLHDSNAPSSEWSCTGALCGDLQSSLECNETYLVLVVVCLGACCAFNLKYALGHTDDTRASREYQQWKCFQGIERDIRDAWSTLSWWCDHSVPLSLHATIWPCFPLHVAIVVAISTTLALIGLLYVFLVQPILMLVALSSAELTYHVFGRKKDYVRLTITGMLLEDIPQFILQLTYCIIMMSVYDEATSCVQIASFVFTVWRAGYSIIMKQGQQERTPTPLEDELLRPYWQGDGWV